MKRRRRRRTNAKPTQLQMWQRNRFEFKGSISSMRTRVQQLTKIQYITSEEWSSLQLISKLLDILYRKIDKRSQLMRTTAEHQGTLLDGRP
jgi:hypothetical protein